MHEMSLAEGIFGIIEEQARQEHFATVRVVRLEIGALSNVEIEALRFCFEVVVRDTVATGAILEIDSIPGTGQCLSCARNVPIKAVYDPCPECGEFGLRVTGGTEMRVKELEVD